MSRSAAMLNPRTTSYEFLGPPGALAVTLVAPFVTYALFFACSEQAGGCPPPIPNLLYDFKTAAMNLEWWKGLWNAQATLMYLAGYAYLVVTWAILPGRWIEGVRLRTGDKKKYKINAFSTFLLTLGLTAGYINRFGAQGFTFIYEKWVGFLTAALLMSIAQGLYCYISSYTGEKLLALGGNTGNVIYDFFIGRELNPSIGSFDIKSFNELRPGLILWFIINISMACEQLVRRDGSITDSMVLVLLFQGWYIIDGLYNESKIFTMMDITTDGFGFMLSFGNIAWVPFVYSLQARYLVFNQVELGPLWTFVTLLANGIGYYIFRSANGEKDEFRRGKNPKHLKYMETAAGSKLIISGWWGRSRHPNYFGDLIIGLTWSLPTGFETPITYFYIVYFFILLAHRQYRDDESCRKKYGKDWDKYVKIVPYRIIPYVY